MLKEAEVSIRQITNSGFKTSKFDITSLKSPARNSSRPLTLIVNTSPSASSTRRLRRTCLRLRMIFVTSSITPGIVANSCSTPSILMHEIAKPSSEERRIRRKALPIVIPKPGSNGRNSNLP